MLNTYIKNRGITKTIVHSNNRNHINQVNWDADYDGDMANISIKTNTDGNREHFDVTLDNEDLANILNVNSINIPIHQRLKNDFKDNIYSNEPYYIELPTPKFETMKPRIIEEDISNHISSPLPNEELIVPLTIYKKTNTLTPRRRHKKPKTHITHRVYKKHKSHSSKSKSKSKSSRHKSPRHYQL